MHDHAFDSERVKERERVKNSRKKERKKENQSINVEIWLNAINKRNVWKTLKKFKHPSSP